ncbi:acyltransferase family protein [Actinacidiphila sp. bgisy144]|uniref:acyltransferase family protein n=1 Tax=Actinacidiphila sp. bgisy144 TaxID=3413791 RepID=UPI003EB7692A
MSTVERDNALGMPEQPGQRGTAGRGRHAGAAAEGAGYGYGGAPQGAEYGSSPEGAGYGGVPEGAGYWGAADRSGHAGGADGGFGGPYARPAADRGFMSAAERDTLVTDDTETVQLRTITVPEAFVHRTDPLRTDPEPAGPDAGPTAGPGAADTAPVSRPRGGRDRYLDLLRALALVRVVVYHNFGWTWLPLVFPSMGVMFALAGSLMARSLKRPAWSVIRSRTRRLLPPMWMFGAVVLTAMVLDGWGPHTDGHPRWWWGELAFWVLPLSTPPYADSVHGFAGHLPHSWAEQVVVPLWYLRAYLWYVLFSPLMLKAVRRLPWVTLLVPLAGSAFLNSGLVDQSGRIMETATDFTTFGACWLLGMAHQEGLLRKIPQYVVPSIAPLVLVAGFWLLQRAPVDNPRVGPDLEAVPLAQAVWSFGCVMLLLHLSPSWEHWPRPLERFNGVITLLNSRAVSVYLWHCVALVMTEPIIDQLWNDPYAYAHLRWLLTSQWLPLLVAIPLIVLALLLFGWVEDAAAKRRPRLFPYPRRVKGRRRA